MSYMYVMYVMFVMLYVCYVCYEYQRHRIRHRLHLLTHHTSLYRTGPLPADIPHLPSTSRLRGHWVRGGPRGNVPVRYRVGMGGGRQRPQQLCGDLLRGGEWADPWVAINVDQNVEKSLRSRFRKDYESLSCKVHLRFLTQRRDSEDPTFSLGESSTEENP